MVFILGIRKKSLLILSASLMLITLMIFLLSMQYSNHIVSAYESKGASDKERIIKSIVSNEVDSVNSACGDWAAWNETLNYVNDANEEYISLNLSSASQGTIDINGIVIYDKSGKIKAKSNFNFGDEITPHTPLDLDALQKYQKLFIGFNNNTDFVKGIVLLKGEPVLISARPITDNSYSTAPQGTLVMLRKIDKKFISKIQDWINCQVEVDPYIVGTNYDGVSIDQSMINYAVINDLRNQPSMQVKFIQSRTLYSNAMNALIYLLLLLFVLNLAVFSITSEMLNRFILKPITNMQSEVKAIISGKNTIGRLTGNTRDEISELAKSINTMLDDLESSAKKVSENEQRLNLVLDGAGAGYWDYDIQKRVLKLSEKAYNMLGYNEGDISDDLDAWINLIHEDDKTYTRYLCRKFVKGSSEAIYLEVRLLTESKEYKWFLIKGNSSEFDREKNSFRITGIIIDIDKKKNIENELAYLTHYDKLTGLYNRAYYEYLISEVKIQSGLTYTIILADINGLKAINETYGYNMGNSLLIEAAFILKKCSPENSLLCRWGGDEFSIILDDVSESEAENICEDIRKSCDTIHIDSVNLSLALGYASEVYTDENINDVIKRAEERMYRNKLLDDKSSRNNYIALLSNTLFEKSHETEEHASRIHSFCEKISEKLALTSAQMDELSLLAKLHDIGKIAIPDHILNKPGKLTDDEWEIMKTHCLIGYRIACSVDDLKHISHNILCHHERYDGTGYPQGIKGNDIPLLARIISIVDAFDVMTHERPYKTAMTVEKAVAEVKRCSGTQFDPALVEICIEVFLSQK